MVERGQYPCYRRSDHRRFVTRASGGRERRALPLAVWKGRDAMSEDHHKPPAELVIADLQRAADEYRAMATAAANAADRDSLNRVANGFERIVATRRNQAVPRRLH
jgi:hypothetical protein